MISRLKIKDTTITYDLWRQISGTSLRDGSVIQTILEDLDERNLALGNVSGYTWLFDCFMEGISSKDINHVVTFFRQHKIKFLVIFSCVEDTGLLDYPAVSLPTRLITNGKWLPHLEKQQINWINFPMVKDFVCLMRRPSKSRALLAKMLLDNFDRNNILVSLGINGGHCDKSIEDLTHPHGFPLIIDGSTIDEVQQHCPTERIFYQTPVNVIVETSDTDSEDTWHSIFLTEKTFKCFAWHQFPIWFAVPGLVQQVRNLGFDVFDDLFDNHSYDSIEDSDKRMHAVVSVVKNFTQQNTTNLRFTHWKRLEQNSTLVKRLHDSAEQNHSKIIQALLNDHRKI